MIANEHVIVNMSILMLAEINRLRGTEISFLVHGRESGGLVGFLYNSLIQLDQCAPIAQTA